MTGVVALGDSITVGVGDVGVSTTGEHAAWSSARVDDDVPRVGWAAHLATLLGARTFTNLATNGARARDVSGSQLGHALELGPTVATLLVGGNDVLRSDFDPREVATHVSLSVAALRDAGAVVLLVRLPTIGLFDLLPGPVRRVMRRRIAAVNAAVDEIGAPRRPHGSVPLVLDAAGCMGRWGPEGWHVDRVHPSAAGHRRLALEAAHHLVRAGALGPAGGSGGGAEAVVLRAAALSALPPAPPLTARLGWLVAEGIPWTVRRGRDLLPGLTRAIVEDLRAERAARALPVSTFAGPRAVRDAANVDLAGARLELPDLAALDRPVRRHRA
ncbi:hypothetical protein GCM10025865_17930 [Paraoerskovia sediminicola]|uniref:SGNH hydrolase-type esterase domain-containing protein n=1 Tax=Paraoerskovia sediminicola TaxID=1138587 RepID=A0ABM8G393_9CELL|nr:SGNH/GDSL hydrolase family protein [Paraoerskovia sediminicola]BDZ42494.1 hypothetical protein GCM10025865_17930 [Paraoerskovia sediminicola]